MNILNESVTCRHNTTVIITIYIDVCSLFKVLLDHYKRFCLQFAHILKNKHTILFLK